jgi:hypothetical protein
MKLTREELIALRQNGAKVKRLPGTKKQANPTRPKSGTKKQANPTKGAAMQLHPKGVHTMNTPQPDNSAADAAKAAAAAAGTVLKIAQELSSALAEIKKPEVQKPRPYRFKVKRDKRGLIDTVEAEPIKG